MPFKDFAPVAMLAKSVNVLVVYPSVPAKTVRELIDYAKANPGKLNFSSSGVGASSHLAGELFKQMAGVEIIHVPYRGTGPSTTDLLAGNVQMAIDSAGTLLPHIKSGGLRALGFATLERQPAMPELPTIAETLPGFDGSSINYINVPAGTPQPIIDRLNREMNAVISDRAIAARMTEIAIMPIVETQADLVKRIADEQEKWKRGNRADEIRIGEIAADQAVAVAQLLRAPDVAVGAVVEHDRDGGDAVTHRGRQLLHVEHEAAIAVDAHHRAVRARRLDAERGGVAPAERALIAGRDEGARPIDRIAEARGVAELGDLVDQDARPRQSAPDGGEKIALRRPERNDFGP